MGLNVCAEESLTKIEKNGQNKLFPAIFCQTKPPEKIFEGFLSF